MANAAAVILMSISLYFTLTESSPTQVPETNTDPHRCHHSLEDQNLPHDSDCSKYYRCVYGQKVPKICPEKMLFNADIGNCDLYYNVDCPFKKLSEEDVRNEQNLVEAIEHLTGKTFANKKSEGTAGDVKSTLEEGEHTATMTRLGGDTTTAKFAYMPHEADPVAYYKIENGERNTLYCEEGMVFSIELEICARPWRFE